jgi:hypothetical protein
MRLQDTITIAEFGPYHIDAVYDYRIEVPYTRKHDSPDVKDIHIDKIELKIRETTLSRGTALSRNIVYRTITLLDIPPWLWELLNSPGMIRELGPLQPDEPISELPVREL